MARRRGPTRGHRRALVPPTQTPGWCGTYSRGPNSNRRGALWSRRWPSRHPSLTQGGLPAATASCENAHIKISVQLPPAALGRRGIALSRREWRHDHVLSLVDLFGRSGLAAFTSPPLVQRCSAVGPGRLPDSRRCQRDARPFGGGDAPSPWRSGPGRDGGRSRRVRCP